MARRTQNFHINKDALIDIVHDNDLLWAVVESWMAAAYLTGLEHGKKEAGPKGSEVW